MARCLLALGSNLGDRDKILEQACSELSSLPNCQLLARSRWHGTVPIGGSEGQGDFLNGAALLETALTPAQLADVLQKTETKLGRERVVRWDARTIDIDILLYDDLIVDSPKLTIPHPRMSFRKFVLEPAAEIAGEILHPTSGWTIAGLLRHVCQSLRYVVVTASEPKLAEWLTVQLCERLDCQKMSSNPANFAAEDAPDGRSKIECNRSACGKPPTLGVRSISELISSGSRHADVRPAVTLWLDPSDADNFAKIVDLADHESEIFPSDWGCAGELSSVGLGPLARITANEPSTVLQEAEAALRSIWPDIGD